MIHMPDGAAKVVCQPSPRSPSDPLVVTVMCACGDNDCAFTAIDDNRWVWSKWQGGMPPCASAPDWVVT